VSIYSNDQKNPKPSQQQQKSYKQNDSPSKSQSNKFHTPQIIPCLIFASQERITL